LSELRPLLRLAGPVILAEIGVMSMGLVDTLMVGGLGPAAIAATGMGSSVFTAIFIFGTGLMLGLDTLVSQSMGAGRPDECLRWLHQGIVLAVLITPGVMLVTWVAFLTIDAWGLRGAIAKLALPVVEPSAEEGRRCDATPTRLGPRGTSTRRFDRRESVDVPTSVFRGRR